MQFVRKITAVAAALSAVACQELPNYFVGDNVVARVGRKALTTADIAEAFPGGMVGTDSARFAEVYTDKWIVKQLKIEEAELLFSSEDDIDRLVEEYRRSLLIRKIDQYYMEQHDSEITDSDVQTYYRDHKSDFRLSHAMVKGAVVAFGEDYRQSSKLRSLMQSASVEQQKDFEDICLKNSLKLQKFSEWTDYSEFLNALPTLRSENYDALLDKGSGVQEMTHQKTRYYFRITELLRAGDTMPLSLCSEQIRRIIRTARQSEAVRAHEEQMMHDAVSSGKAKIYYEDSAASDKQ